MFVLEIRVERCSDVFQRVLSGLCLSILVVRELRSD